MLSPIMIKNINWRNFMTRQCPVILNNSVVTVVKYGDKEIQFSALKRDVDTVYVEYKNGKYKVIDKPEEELRRNNLVKKELKIENTALESDDEPALDDISDAE